MYLDVLLGLIIGILGGCFTGLIPGVHVNLIALTTVSFSSYLLNFVGLEFVLVFIISLSITHSFLNVIPSIFLGAPEPSTALSVLPGHALLMEGKGVEAVKLTLTGSLLGLVACFLLYPLLEFVILYGYGLVETYIGELLFIVGIFLIVRSGNVVVGFFAYVCSGFLGYLVLDSGMSEPLFPLLSGLFGLSTLIFSLKSVSGFPEQKKVSFSVSNIGSSVSLGSVSGFITAVLPGLGSSSAAAISSLFKKENDREQFLVLIGSISTVNFFMSIAALNVIGKARNGSIVAIQQLINDPPVLLMVIPSLVAAGSSVFLAKYLSVFFSKKIGSFSYEKIVYGVVVLIILMTFVLSSYKGLFVLFLSTVIGLYVNLKGLPRNILMSCIMLPVMLYFL